MTVLDGDDREAFKSIMWGNDSPSRVRVSSAPSYESSNSISISYIQFLLVSEKIPSKVWQSYSNSEHSILTSSIATGGVFEKIADPEIRYNSAEAIGVDDKMMSTIKVSEKWR